MKIAITFLSLIIPFHLLAQEVISVGNTAPPIHITNWLANTPGDQDLSNTHIVLEFWATWCGPCIAAVPHMNELQDKMKGQDLVFLSMTYETPKKVDRTLKRVPFKSVVVSDTTKSTQINFGDGEEGLASYPLTVLIDKKQVIQWIGHPNELNTDILKNFVEGTSIKTGKEEPAIQPTEVVSSDSQSAKPIQKKMGIEDFLKMWKNPEIVYHLDIKSADDPDAGSKVKIDKGTFMATSSSIKEIYDQAFSMQVTLNSDLQKQYYDIVYINRNATDASLDRLELEILQILNLKKSETTKTIDAYSFTLKDASKLEPSESDNPVTRSDANDQTIYNGYTLPELMADLSKTYQVAFSIETNNETPCEFFISSTSIDQALEDLATYGLVYKKAEKEVTEIMITKKE